jgi:heme exporter protein B
MTKFIALFKKDFLLELRQQYTFYGIVLYVASTIFVLYLAMGNPEPFVWNGLFWMIQLFVCVNAVAKSFLQEGRGRLLYFYSIAGARDFILAKLLFNALLIHPLRFVGMAVLGGMGLSIIFTFLSAIAARAGQGAALMAILGFPLVIPQILLIMKLTNTVFSDVFLGASGQIAAMLLVLDALIIVLAMILFPFLWKD